MKKKLKNNIEQGLLHFHMEASDEVIESSLKEVLPHYDAYQSKKAKALKRLNFTLNAMAHKEHDEKLLKVAARLMDGLATQAEKPIAIIKTLLQGHTSKTPALFRNLDKLTEQDLYEILKDKNLVELLEQLDGNEAQN